jgi:hypothetical protein
MSAQRLHLGMATLLVALFAVLPIYGVTYIPANDYPFHLSRIAILSMGDKSGLLGTFYQFGSWLLPNMALDAFALPLTHWMSPEAAVKLFLVVTQLAFLGGCVALHRAAFGRYCTWPLLCGLLLYNGIFLYGFFNYLFAAAFALPGAALWLRSDPGWRRYLVAFGVAVVLMWGHMGGFAVYAILVGSFQMHTRLANFSKQNIGKALTHLGLDALPFIAALALFIFISPGTERAGDGLVYSPWWGAKPFGALFTLQSGVLWADVLVGVALAALVMVLLLTRQLALNGAVLTAAGMLWLAFVVLPPDMLGSSFADVRLVPLAALVTLLAFAPQAGKGRWSQALVLAVALGVGGVKTVALLRDWQAHQPKVDHIVQAMKKIPDGSTLFAATAAPFTGVILSEPGVRESWHPPLKHVASYASVYGSVFVPMTFADPHKQPMVMMPPYLAVKDLQGDNPFKVPLAADLVNVAQRIAEQVHLPGGPVLGGVYLLVLGADRYARLPALAGFSVFFAGDGFVIFKAAAHPTPGTVMPLTGGPHGG